MLSIRQISPLLLTAALLCITSCGGKERRHRSDRSDESSSQTEQISENDSSDKQQHASADIDFKLYMERSGSMVSFDSQGSKGEFKSIVSTMLNRFPKVAGNDSTYVYIVNDNIYPYKGTVKDFLAQRDFFSSTKNVGNPAYTDFDKIFEMILGETKKYQVSALVSDLIYSVNGQQNVTASKLLNEAYALTHNVFKGHTDTNVIVLKFEADYNGPYYPYNSPSKGIQFHGERPFYVMLFMSDDTMEALYSVEKYQAFTNFKSLPEFENMFSFTDNDFHPAFSIVPDYNHEGRYRKERGNHTKTISGICEAQLSKEGELTIPIALDLSELPFSNSYKEDKDLYEVESSTGYKVKSIKTIKDMENASVILDRLPTATHILTLETESKPQNEEVRIKLSYRLPEWVEKSSSSDDSDLKSDSFSDTTFGFNEIMKGIYASYVPDGSKHFLFDISISVKKK